MTRHEDEIIERALSILELRLRARAVFSDPDAIKSFLRLQSRGLAEEMVGVMYLDGDRRLIEYERLTSVDANAVANKALLNRAAAVIVHHHHADGCCWPSLSSCEDATKVEEALGLLDLPLLNHVITAVDSLFSVTERKFI